MSSSKTRALLLAAVGALGLAALAVPALAFSGNGQNLVPICHTHSTLQSGNFHDLLVNENAAAQLIEKGLAVLGPCDPFNPQ